MKSFFADSFEITSSKYSKIIGSSLTGLLLLVVVFFRNQFTSLKIPSKWLLLLFALVAPLIIGALTTFKIRIKNDLFDKIWHFVWFLLSPVVIITMTECLNRVFIYNMTYIGFIGNYIAILVLLFLVFAACGRFKVAILFVSALCYGFALGHAYVVEFRGTPFIPMDFLGIKTAVNVANTYNYTPTHTIIIGSLIFIFLVVTGLKTNTPKYNLITKITSRTFMGTFATSLALIFYFTSIFADAGIKPDFWSQTRGYRNYGFVLSYLNNTKYLYMSEPNGYNPDNVGDYVSSAIDKDNTNNIVPTGDEANIICIMNESLSDLSVLGDFTTNQDYMPFMRNLTENTVKGNLYVPVIGAGTSNTEFEFLTGHTTAFLPAGSNAYVQYVDNPLSSLVSTLEGQGYSSWAFHPYYSVGWNRVNVYDNFGFNRRTFLEHIISPSILNDYAQHGRDPEYLQTLVNTHYPENKNMLVRQYVSDSYNYDVIIQNFEKRDKTKPYFAFNVTMQNHGGYFETASNFNECIEITSTSVQYPKTNKYLSLIKESDNAFKKLIEYFEGVEEPTVICMFGDHQPSIETEFIESLLDSTNINNLSLKQEQARHITPFFIWANYDIEEKYIDKLSSNYLSSYVLDIAGAKLTEYNKYLLKLSKTIPVIDTVGYIDANDNYYKWSDSSEHTQILGEYEKVQYNAIFDHENTNNSIFFLDGYVMPEILAEREENKK